MSSSSRVIRRACVSFTTCRLCCFSSTRSKPSFMRAIKSSSCALVAMPAITSASTALMLPNAADTSANAALVSSSIPALRGQSALASIHIIPAAPEHIDAMTGNLRADHEAELAARGLTDRAALELGLRYSVVAWTALEGDEPIAMWGYTASSLLGEVACPWLITTTGTLRHKMRFWREVKAGITAMLALYPVLANEFDRTDIEACRLLRRLGFVPVILGERFTSYARLR